MKIFLTGGSGQVGWELQRTLSPLGEVVAPARDEVDLSSLEGLRLAVRHVAPEVIVNAAAYTDVDRAEREPEIARRVNAEAPAVLAEEARRLGACLVHYSTDYVFDGQKGEPYTEEDAPDPLNAYGRSKLEGEQAVQHVGGAYVILRTSWVYSLRRPCFLTRILEQARERSDIRVVTDQVGSPTWARLVAEATAMILAQAIDGPRDFLEQKSGIYHVACRGSCSRYEWARLILALAGREAGRDAVEVLPAESRDFLQTAPRPRQTALSCDRLAGVFGLRLPTWDVGARLALEA